MGLDRNKTLLNAEKFVRQGKIDQAIPLYQQVVDVSPKDMNLKNKVGDLYTRVGDNGNAIRLFGQIADFYGEEGFYLKAIAVLKKINRIDPANVDCYFKLGELYRKQGLNNDARSQYQQAAELVAKDGDSARAADALAGILAIEPDNIKVRLRLAELHAKLGQNEKSLEAYSQVGDELIKKGMLDEAHKIFEKGLSVDPGHPQLVAGLCKALLSLGRTGEVIDRARAAYPNNRENVAMLGVLGDAYLRTQQNDPAAQVFEKLTTLEPENPAWKERLRQARGQVASPVAAVVPAHDHEMAVADHMMDEIEQLSGQDWDVSDLAPDTAAVDAGSGGGGASERDEFVLEHQTEAEVFIKYGLVEKAIENLEAIVNRYEDETESLRRLKDLYLETGNKAKAAARCVDLARIAKARGEIPKAMDLLAEARAHDPNVDVDRTPGHQATGGLGVVGSEAGDVYSFGDTGSGEVPVEFDAGPPSSGVELQFDMSPASSAEHTEDGDYQIDFSEKESEPDGIDFDLGDGDGDGGGVDFELSSEPEDGEVAEAALYIEQGSLAEAKSCIDALKVRFSSSRKVADLESRLAASRAVPIGIDDGVKFFEEAIRPDRRQTDSGSFAGASGSFEESIFEQETGFLDEVETPGNFSPKSSSGEDSIDALLKDLKTGVEAQVESEDYETHYNLGIAYKEMGLIDEAIGEFQQSAKDDGKFIDSCANLGVCFREKGMAKLAMRWYGKALEKVEEGSDQYVALLYDLAEAHEESGDTEKALEMFTDVYGLNSTYREVADKLDKLG